jgi:hypothetical protein
MKQPNECIRTNQSSARHGLMDKKKITIAKQRHDNKSHLSDVFEVGHAFLRHGIKTAECVKVWPATFHPQFDHHGTSFGQP